MKNSDEEQVCTRCIVDTTIESAFFDDNGECNFCKIHDVLENAFPKTQAGPQELNKILQEIKHKGRNNEYDCVVGISGGRDSTYMLYMAKKVWGLRPLAVYFNDGFGNPVAGENMQKAISKLDVDLITVSADWRESKDLKLAFLRASTPDIAESTDVGISAALYGVAHSKGIAYVLNGQSFRTEGIMPLNWFYYEGKYLKAVQKKFGNGKLRKWTPDSPGFTLDLKHIFYYTFIKRIQIVMPFYYFDYVRMDAEKIIKEELDWVYPGAHYFDDLYQSLISFILYEKFNIDRRKINYSALVRSGQMERSEALEKVKIRSNIELDEIITLCLKRLQLSKEEFNNIMNLPIKTFRDYPNNYGIIKFFKWAIYAFSKIGILPPATYLKYFKS